MRNLIIISALLLASASAQAQTIDVGSVLSANGIATGAQTGQPQPDAAMQDAAGLQAAGAPQAGAGQQDPKHHASATRGGAAMRESAEETKARRIAARYGVSW